MHLGPTGRRLALTVVLVLGALVVPPAATQDIALVRVTATKLDWTSSYFYHRVQGCPKDHVVVDGGARIIGGNGQVRLTGLKPVMGSFHGYSARAEEIGGAYPGRWALDLFAVCAPERTIPGYISGSAARPTDRPPASHASTRSAPAEST